MLTSARASRPTPMIIQPSKGLIWSDEFNGPAGQLPNSANWIYDIGASGWGNSELEYYTNAPVTANTGNVSLDGNSNLQIIARKELAPDSVTQYTSARIKTQGKQQFTPPNIRVAARMSVPWTKGLWPAFWMDGVGNASYPNWPGYGEVDIHEIGLGGTYNVAGHAHYGQVGALSTHLQNTSHKLTMDAQQLPQWVVYGIDFYADQLIWHMDGVTVGVVTQAQAGNADWTPYTGAFPWYVILNTAVGGTGSGPPDGSSVFPQTMLIDWVRVYSI